VVADFNDSAEAGIYKSSPDRPALCSPSSFYEVSDPSLTSRKEQLQSGSEWNRLGS